MHTESVIERSAAPSAGVAEHARAETETEAATGPPAPSSSPPGTRRPGRSVLGKVLGVLRGDKYMAGAYPPEWEAPATRATVTRGDDAATTRVGAPSETPPTGS
jgi:hypothetical protein